MRTIYRTENINRYFSDIKNHKYDPISDSAIRKLFEDRNKNHEQILNAHIRLVATIAKTYDNNDKFMDYNQEGIEGLIKAIDKYDPTQDTKFSTYAAYWIKAKMSMLCKEFNMVQRSNQGRIGSKVVKFQEQFIQDNMREASTDEIIEHLGENSDIDIQYANELFNINIVSIDENYNDNDKTSIESCREYSLKTASVNDVVKEMEKEHLANDINKMFRVLNDKEKEFVTRHILNEESYDTIAKQYNYTTERVRQIIKTALHKMKSCDYAKKNFSSYLK